LIGEGHIASVFGSDYCPHNTHQFYYYNCTKLKGEQTFVTLSDGQKSWSEIWIIVDIENRITLVRPNGYHISDAKNLYSAKS
jgi:hypothetical protein